MYREHISFILLYHIVQWICGLTIHGDCTIILYQQQKMVNFYIQQHFCSELQHVVPIKKWKFNNDACQIHTLNICLSVYMQLIPLILCINLVFVIRIQLICIQLILFVCCMVYRAKLNNSIQLLKFFPCLNNIIIIIYQP